MTVLDLLAVTQKCFTKFIVYDLDYYSNKKIVAEVEYERGKIIKNTGIEKVLKYEVLGLRVRSVIDTETYHVSVLYH